MKMRVRYTLNQENQMVSEEMLSVESNQLLTSQFNPEQLTGSVNVVNGAELVSVKGSSLHDVKKKLKTALKQQGVRFSEEGRKKKVVTLEE